jgi:hypothetical protein
MPSTFAASVCLHRAPRHRLVEERLQPVDDQAGNHQRAEVRVGNLHARDRPLPGHERARERMRFRAVARFHQLFQADRQAERRDDERDHAVLDQRIDDAPLEPDTEHEHRRYAGQQEREPQRRAERDAEQHPERRQHDELALREVDRPRRLPQQSEAQRRKRVDRAGRGAGHKKLDQVPHDAFSSLVVAAVIRTALPAAASSSPPACRS